MTVREVERLLAEDRRPPPADVADVPEAAAADADAEEHARYEEYVRGLDEVPVLRDVVHEPPRVVVRDFRLGERPDARRQPREDPYTLREQAAREIDGRYAEYAATPTRPSDPLKRPSARKPAARNNKAGKRSKRR
jgi:hypothetical protein